MQDVSETDTVRFLQILQTVRLQYNPEPAHFGIPALDNIVNSALAAKRTTANIHSHPGPPILELIPQAPGRGTTHLLYLLTATAILPSSLGGKDSCVAIIDTDNTFSVSRLVQQIHAAIKSHSRNQREQNQHPPKDTTAEIVEVVALETSTINSALRHVHIFRPQSHPSLLATLASLPTYFLNNGTNPSLHRPLSFIALDSLPAFHWQTRAESETKAFEEEEIRNQEKNPQPLYPTRTTTPPNARAKTLPNLLQTLAQIFPSTPQLHTNPSHFPRLSSLLQPTHQHHQHHHPQKPISLTLSRQIARPFPPMISLAEALREKAQREIAVRKARWWVGSTVPVGGREGGMMGFEVGIDGERGVWVVED